MTAALNRFISRSADRCRPFFQLLNKWKGFEWTEECEVAFQQLKEYLSCLPIMSRPDIDEVLYAYIAVADRAVSLVLIRVDNNVQKPIYYVSKSLHEAEVHYLPLEKAILVVVHATRKLPHYFQSHMVVVLTQLPLKSVLCSADYTSKIVKWGTILGAFDVRYMSCTSVKGQVLADLVTEFAEPTIEESVKRMGMDEKSVGMVACKEHLVWKVDVDGAANQRGSGVGLVVVTPKGVTLEKSLRLGFSATNNEAEYEALVVGMDMVQRMGGKAVQMFSDSQLVVGQVEGKLEARDPRMQEYLTQVRYLQSKFESFTLSHVSRSGNTHADSLANLATSSAQGLARVILVEDLCKPIKSNGNHIQVHQVRVGPSWMDPIVSFLKDDGNGQAEAVNKVIVSGLKKRLDDAKGRWVKELLHVLWTYRTTPRRSTGEIPFSMTYGAEAVIPLETGFPKMRASSFTPSDNDSLLEKSLDLVEERREIAMVQLACYQQKLKQGYDSRVNPRPLAPEDLVLRKVLGTAKNPAWGKLGPNWEGPYRITSVAGIRVYYLVDLDEKIVRHPWNVSNLRRYYY
ncbi:uncharacterized protein LOC142606487 [Castanea sativa]|uniref:uncharacterized protein LOC142606487 n=1 Tax=Castanea sativa TaxID=21020 RepID=UPI003F650B8D